MTCLETLPQRRAQTREQIIKYHILIVGSTGLVGTAVVDHFNKLPEWHVTTVARRTLTFPDKVRQLQIDLTDADACLRGLSGKAQKVTHVLYTALFEKPNLVASWRDEEQMTTNLAMLRNVLDALDQVAPQLRHITLLQGAKAYGLHLGPTPVPCKERSGRHPHKNFYWLQEDLLRERKLQRGWTFSILRPQLVLGTATGPMNIVIAIGALAAIQRELGKPLCFPGGAYGVYGASDSRLIASATEFVGTHEICSGETYNIVNGDVFAWKDIWPGIADHFHMPVGEPAPMCLADTMPQYEEVWKRIAARHGLAEVSLAHLVDRSWQFADRAFGYGFEYPPHSVLNGLKLRSHGYNDFLDTEDAIRYWLQRLQLNKVLPL